MKHVEKHLQTMELHLNIVEEMVRPWTAMQNDLQELEKIVQTV